MNAASGASDKRLARVDVLIVNYNAGAWLARCTRTVRPPGCREPALIVVDNGSTDGSLEAIENKSITIDRAGRNAGFAAGVNRAAGHASREFLLILNPDCLIEPADLARLVAELDGHPEAALVSGKVLGQDGVEQRGSRRCLPTPGRIAGELLPLGTEGVDRTHTPPPDRSEEVEAVSGACMLVRRTAFEQVGGMDESYPLHFEDLDLFARLIEAGWSLRWVPDVRIVHAGGQSSRMRPVAVLWAKHRGLWCYLRNHCARGWPRWQRPLWLLALTLHAVIKTPVVWAASRFKSAR